MRSLALVLILAGCGAQAHAAPESPVATPTTLASGNGAPLHEAATEAPRARLSPNDEATLPAESPADEAAAALYASVDLQPEKLESLELPDPSTTDLARFIERIVTGLAARQALAERLAARFDPVAALGSERWRIAALVRQGQIYEALAASAVHAMRPQRLPRFVVRDERGQVIRSLPGSQDELAATLLTTITSSVEPVVCRAIVRYTMALRQARVHSIDSREAVYAAARLESFPEERRDACIF